MVGRASGATDHGPWFKKPFSLYRQKKKKYNFASNGRNRCNRVTVFSFYIINKDLEGVGGILFWLLDPNLKGNHSRSCSKLLFLLHAIKWRLIPWRDKSQTSGAILPG